MALVFLSGCSSSKVGMGVGVSGISGVGGTEIIADTKTGVHGSIVMGSDIRL